MFVVVKVCVMFKVICFKLLEGGKGCVLSLFRLFECVCDCIIECVGGLLVDMFDGVDDILFDLVEKEIDSECDCYFDVMCELCLQCGVLEIGFWQVLGNLFQDSVCILDDWECVIGKVVVEDLVLVKYEELEIIVVLDNLVCCVCKGYDEVLCVFQYCFEYLFESKVDVIEWNNFLELCNLVVCFFVCLEWLFLDICVCLIVFKLFEWVVMDEVGVMVDEVN